MSTTLLLIVVVPIGLALMWSAATIATYRAAPPSNRGESRRQQELLDRAVDLRGEVLDEFWPHVAPQTQSAQSKARAASVR